MLKVGKRTQATSVPVVASLVNDSISYSKRVVPSVVVNLISCPAD
ncbi:MAG: hypothetical protein R1F52_06810 [Candidatus Nitrosoabyssus spongiisocia]|nr:MAG: hypothetical protein R1F52_06810 [Nitrosopumilaceae archaeon AB1(1)]